MSEKGNDFESAVITDDSDAQATKIYYNKWSQQVRSKVDTNSTNLITWYKKEVFVDRDPRLNAAGPITDSNNSDITCSYYGKWSGKVL